MSSLRANLRAQGINEDEWPEDVKVCVSFGHSGCFGYDTLLLSRREKKERERQAKIRFQSST